MTRTELREIAIQAILTEVRKGYTIDDAVKRLSVARKEKGETNER